MKAPDPSRQPAECEVTSGGLVEVGRYRLQGLLGRGGMATVHRAYDTARGIEVALKRMELEDASRSDSQMATTFADARKRQKQRARLTALFQHEYRTLAQLSHPRIVEVYDYGLFDERPYYTMELLSGSDLSQLACVPWRQVCSILADIASGLTLLHARRLLHRDISPRNVHTTHDGRAKLLDFGAMSTMGVNDLVVGTPAFVAPEVLEHQPLDARCDLFALGVLGYVLLTHALPYEVHRFGDIAEAMRVPPRVPSQIAPATPPALDTLIIQLLQPNRSARPSSALEVAGRLALISGQEPVAQVSGASAWLSAPPLVARESHLRAVRRRALRAQRAGGASLLVRAEQGLGRTRFLDACALEGKLSGCTVLRVDGVAAGALEYGAVRALLLQLHASLAPAEREALQLPEAVREQLLPGVAWERSAGEQLPERASDLAPAVTESLARPLHDFLLRVTVQKPLMILIDDFETLDASSAALFASLSRAAASKRLVLVTVCTSELAGADADPVLHILQEYSRKLTIVPLTAADTSALLTSICGDVPHLTLLADRLHVLTAGKPSLCIEWLRHLIDQRVIRFEAGTFVLPESLSASDFPHGLEQVLRARSARLSAPARRLGALVAVCAGAPLSVEQCLRAAAGWHATPADPQRAFEELVAADIVVTRTSSVTLRQEAFASALLAELDEPALLQLHAEAAQLLGEDPRLWGRAAQHYMRAGLSARAVQLLVTAAQTDALMQECLPDLEALLTRAIEACARLDRPARDAFLLRRARARHRAYFVVPGELSQLIAHAEELFEAAGLRELERLPAELPSEARLRTALQRALDRYQQTPEHERTCAPLEAITDLATYTAALASMATSTMDDVLFEHVTWLAPLTSLAPSLELTHGICMMLRELRTGHHDEYYRHLEQHLARVIEPDHGGLPPQVYERVFYALTYGCAMTDASLGRPRAFERARQLDSSPLMQAHAWRVRRLAHLYRGDSQSAEECRREVEWLQLQDNIRQQYAQGTWIESEVIFYSRLDDAIGIRRNLPSIERIAQRFPGWQTLLWLAKGELARILGHYDVALGYYDRVLQVARPGHNLHWAYTIGYRVQALVEAGRVAEARAEGYRAIEIAESVGYGIIMCGLQVAVAQAESALGDHVQAIARVDAALERVQQLDISGLYAALYYEQRARLALRVGDHKGFAFHLERCAQCCGTATDSPFAPRIASLRAEGRARHEAAESIPALPNAGAGGQLARVRRALRAITNTDECATRALELLVELTGAQAGHLFARQGEQLTLLASRAPAGDELGLCAALQRFVQLHELSCDETAVMDLSELAPGASLQCIENHAGLVYAPLLLSFDDGAQVRLVAIAAVRGCRPRRQSELSDVLSEIARWLHPRTSVS